MTRFSSFVLTFTVGLATACSAQKDDAYDGDPLVTVRGDVQSASTTGSVEAEVALAWSKFVESPDTTEAVTAKVRGSFPARFEIDVLSPPPDDSINRLEDEDGVAGKERPFAIAQVLALRPGDAASLKERILGVAEDHVVVYVPVDVEPETITAVVVGAPLRAGFHLMKVTRLTEDEKLAVEACQDTLPEGPTSVERMLRCGRVYDRLSEVPAGFDTSIVVTIGARESLRFPNYF